MRTTIALAGGNEVCFVCQVGPDGVIVGARPVARGDVSSVLALPGFAQRGEMLVHNHPSGVLEPSGPDMEIAARVHGDGIGFGIIDNAVSRIYVVVEVPREKARVALDPARDRRDARARRADRRAALARGPLRGPPEPARDGRAHRAPLQRSAASD